MHNMHKTVKPNSLPTKFLQLLSRKIYDKLDPLALSVTFIWSIFKQLNYYSNSTNPEKESKLKYSNYQKISELVNAHKTKLFFEESRIFIFSNLELNKNIQQFIH